MTPGAHEDVTGQLPDEPQRTLGKRRVEELKALLAEKAANQWATIPEGEDPYSERFVEREGWQEPAVVAALVAEVNLNRTRKLLPGEVVDVYRDRSRDYPYVYLCRHVGDRGNAVPTARALELRAVLTAVPQTEKETQT